MPEETEKKIAILIDADNISYKKIEEILNEVKRYGIPTIKRIYGDWTSPYVENWKDSLLTHAITPIQQYSYTQGKNSTDSALIIDAMDILHSDRVDGFCIVSSDSDFTRLATRLRESGKLVIGIGERKTPKPFISSCDKFIYVEILEKEVSKKVVKKKNTNTNTTTTPTPVDQHKISALDEETLELLKDTVDDTADESGWAFLGEIGSLFNKRKPDFDARNYGYEKISHLFKAYKEDFEIDVRNSEKSRIKNYYIRNIINKPVSTNVEPIQPAQTHTKHQESTTSTQSAHTHAKHQTKAAPVQAENVQKKGQQNNTPAPVVNTKNQQKAAPVQADNAQTKGQQNNAPAPATNAKNQQKAAPVQADNAQTKGQQNNAPAPAANAKNQQKTAPVQAANAKNQQKATPVQTENAQTKSPQDDATDQTNASTGTKTPGTALETAIIPTKGNLITAEDVTKNQIRITKDLKSLFPNKTKKIRIRINNEYECAFSYRRDRSHVLSLGQEAAHELALEAGASLKLTKLGENSYQLEKISKESN
ncbi:NYN domain-containing protein [Sphingobacterium faecium]|uniref:NYN domain-containing protein n=1 Tax=Sphingobacterium faecium TaxID=34087 RepID=UPI0024688AC7|nr:NYN domain-containing protein [Sphingobacterium faecium]MDH5825740.1 NYN domain-containing protein [Sphingobacterium faecium]